MSDANLQVGIESGQAVSGSRTVVRSINDIYNAASSTDAKLRSMESTLGKVGSNSGLTQAKAAAQSLQSPLQSIKAELEKIESRIVRIGVTAIALGVVNTIFGKIKETLSGAVKAVDDFQISVISIAASLTQIRIANGETDIAKAYQISSQYAGELALKLQEVDKNSFANYKGLMAMLQVMTAQGQVLDINNKKQVDAFTNLSNAIAIMTPGQDQQMQMYQETRAIMSGVADKHSQVARMLDQQIKAQGIYKGGLKEVAALGRQHGDTIERIAPYLRGIGAASGDIAQTWSTVVATFETALNFIQRMAFGPIVKDLTQMVSLFSDLMKSNTGGISDAVQGAWGYIKEAVFVIDEKTKKLKFSEDFLTTLKIAADITKAIIDSFAILIKWTIKYSDEMKALLEVYLVWKAYSILTNVIIRATTVAIEKNTAAQVVNTQSIFTAYKQESLRLASQKEYAASQVAQAQIISTITAEELSRATVLREGLLIEQASNAEKIGTLAMLRQETAANVALLESKLGLAIINKQAKLDAIELLAAQKAQIVNQIANGNSSKLVANQLMIAETELAAMRRSSSALSGVVTRVENQLTVARVALTDATIAHTAAVNVAAKTGFQLHVAKEGEIAARVANKIAIDAENVAIGKQIITTSAATLGSRALAAATSLLSGALSLVGGPVGALILAVGALTYAWIKLTKAEEENRKLKLKEAFESDLGGAKKELEEVQKQLKEAQRAKLKKIDPVKAALTEEQERQSKLTEVETKLISQQKEAIEGLNYLKNLQATKELPVSKKEIEFAEQKVKGLTAQVNEYRKVSDATAKAKSELEDLNKETMKGYKGSGKPIDEEKGKKTESEKAMDRLINGYEQWQQIAIRTGKVEDELGAKILGHQTAVDNLLKDTAKAKGPQADAIRASINDLLAETIAIETNLDWKKQRFDILNQMQEKEKTNNSDTLRSSQLLHAKGVIDDQQYLDAQLLAKQTEIDIQKKYLDQKIQVMQDLNINTKDKADLLLELEKNKNLALANIDSDELARISDTNKKKAIERQKDLDDVKRKSEEYQSILSLQVAKGNISSSKSTLLGMGNELSVLYKERSLLEDKGFNDVLSVTELQQVIQALEDVDNKISIVQNKVQAFAADQDWVEGMKRGLQSYAEEAGNIGKQIEQVMGNAFKGMEDALVEFVTTGKANFKDLANSIIEDVIRMSIRAGITGPLSSAFSGLFPQANGGVWENGVQKFALGGVVNSPTIFPMSKGLGLMGEAGPEAIMPLTRTPSGKLGVESTGTNQTDLNVEVNVINQGSQQQDAKVSNPRFDGRKYVVDVILQDVQSGGPLRGLIASGKGGY